MKNFLLLFFLLSFGATAQAGHVVRNGGDSYGQEFIKIGIELVELLKKDPLMGVNAQDIEGVLAKTYVYSQDELDLNGVKVDAINIPDAVKPQIIVSRKSWESFKSERHKKIFLVFHEYLTLAGYNDDKYQISLGLDRADVCSRTPAVREGIEQAMKKSCYRLVMDDLTYLTKVLVKYADSDTKILTADYRNLTSLESVNLAGKYITSLPPALFQDMASLHTVDLSLDRLSALSEDLLASNPDLRNFLLNSDALEKIPAKLFANNPLTYVVHFRAAAQGGVYNSHLPIAALREIDQAFFLYLNKGTFFELAADYSKIDFSSWTDFPAGASVKGSSLTFSGKDLEKFPLHLFVSSILARDIYNLVLKNQDKELLKSDFPLLPADLAWPYPSTIMEPGDKVTYVLHFPKP